MGFFNKIFKKKDKKAEIKKPGISLSPLDIPKVVIKDIGKIGNYTLVKQIGKIQLLRPPRLAYIWQAKDKEENSCFVASIAPGKENESWLEERLGDIEKIAVHRKLKVIGPMRRYGASLSLIVFSNVINNRYELKKLIIEDSFQETYEAFDREKSEKVLCTICFMPKRYKLPEEPVLRKFETKQSLIKESHPNLLNVIEEGLIKSFGVFIRHTFKPQLYYTITEYCSDIPFSLYLSQKRKRVGPDQLCTIIYEISSILKHLSENNWMHSHIRPENIWIKDDEEDKGHIYINGFSLLNIETHQESDSFKILQNIGEDGNPLFMAPEQVSGEDINTKADQFSLGVVLYNLVNGRNPFKAATKKENLRKISRFTLPENAFAKLPAWLKEAIIKLLNTDSEDRYEDLQELLNIIEANYEKLFFDEEEVAVSSKEEVAVSSKEKNKEEVFEEEEFEEEEFEDVLSSSEKEENIEEEEEEEEEEEDIEEEQEAEEPKAAKKSFVGKLKEKVKNFSKKTKDGKKEEKVELPEEEFKEVFEEEEFEDIKEELEKIEDIRKTPEKIKEKIKEEEFKDIAKHKEKSKEKKEEVEELSEEEQKQLSVDKKNREELKKIEEDDEAPLSKEKVMPITLEIENKGLSKKDKEMLEDIDKKFDIENLEEKDDDDEYEEELSNGKSNKEAIVEDQEEWEQEFEVEERDLDEIETPEDLPKENKSKKEKNIKEEVEEEEIWEDLQEGHIFFCSRSVNGINALCWNAYAALLEYHFLRFQVFKEKYMVLYILGAFFMLLGFICFYFVQQGKKKLETITAFPKMNVEKVIGGAFFNAKVRGKIISDEPFTSELSQKQCVYYRSEVHRKYETIEKYEDSDGRTQTRRETHKERVSFNEKKQDFYIDDGTGTIKICLEGADFESEKVLDEYKYSDGSEGMTISFGNFNFNIGNILSNQRTLGYFYEEWIIPIDKEILVIGGVRKDGETYFTAPDDNRYKYLISFKQESELISAINKDTFYTKIAMSLCFLLGIGSLMYQILQNVK